MPKRMTKKERAVQVALGLEKEYTVLVHISIPIEYTTTEHLQIKAIDEDDLHTKISKIQLQKLIKPDDIVETISEEDYRDTHLYVTELVAGEMKGKKKIKLSWIDEIEVEEN